MSSNHTNSSQAMRASSRERIVSIDWNLLFRRTRRRVGQFFNSAKHKAAQTEYTPPLWLTRFRLTWFRLGLIALFLYVFTQKQIDFNFSVGKDGVYAGGTPAAQLSNPSSTSSVPANQMSVLPIGNPASIATANSNWSIERVDRATVEAYIQRFERVARTEAEKYGIPVAGKLAMAILESQAGTSPVAIENNNHFGSATPNGYYPNAWTNWRSHSEYLKHEFPQLTNEATNLEGWVAALARSNYAPDARQYAEQLQQIIQTYNLERY